MDPSSSPPTTISFFGGQERIHQRSRSHHHPSEPEPEQQELLHQHYIQEQQQQQQHSLNCDSHDEDDNGDDEHNAENTRQQTHRPQHLQTVDNIHEIDDKELRQRIAQKMLTTPSTIPNIISSTATASNRNNVNEWMWSAEENGYFHSIPKGDVYPPWEEETAYYIDNFDIHRRHNVQVVDPAPPPPSSSSLFPRMRDPTAANDDDHDNTTKLRTVETSTPFPKSVTFRTHDEVHQFDEQLELFKYVDEEFFNVAHYLLEVVDFDEDNDVFVKDEEEEEEEGGHYLKRFGCFGVVENNDHAPKIGDRRGGGAGLLSRLFGCGLGVGNDGILRDSIQENGEEMKHQRTNLVSNFVAALNFRMENIQSKRDGKEAMVEEEHDLVVRTMEVVRKINTYGLPMMMPLSSRCEGVATTAANKIGTRYTNNGSVSLFLRCIHLLSLSSH